MIARVRLRGWKSHLDTEIAFGKGVNALVGIIGSGKSSIMDGISFGLFGTFPGLQGRKVGLDDILMERPKRVEEAEVEIEFLANGKKYSVRRVIRRGRGTEAEIREDGVLRETGAKGVTREVERILGMDYEVFSKAVYSEQNGVDYFLKIPAGRRKEHIDRMLRLDRFEVVRGEAVLLGNRVKAAREEKIRLAEEMGREGLEERREKILGEIREFRERAGGLDRERERAENERREMEERIEGMEGLEREVAETDRIMERLGGSVREIGERDERLRKILAGKDLGKLDIEIRDLEAGLEERRRGREEQARVISSAEERRRIALKSIMELEGMDERCNVCGSFIGRQKKEGVIGERKREAGEIGLEIERIRRTWAGLEREIRSAEKELEGKRIERERVSLAFRERKELEGKVAVILRERELLEGKISGLRERLTGIDLRGMRRQLQEKAGEEGRLREEVSGLRARASDREALLELVERRVGIMERYREEVRVDGGVVSGLDKFDRALRRTQEELRKSFLESVNRILGEVWEGIYPYGDFEGVRIWIEGGDYSLQLKGRDWMDAEAVSGGERSLACLALRIAFSLAFVPELRWLILDEPTHNLDENAVRQLGEALRERIPRYAGQVFIITHDSLISEGMENVFRLERKKDEGGATTIRG